MDSLQVISSTKIYDLTGEIVLYDFHKNTRRTEIPFSEMGDNIKKATVANEDDQLGQLSIAETWNTLISLQ